MSRIGKKPVLLPDAVTTEFVDNKLTVKGPSGTLIKNIHPDVLLDIDNLIDYMLCTYYRGLV